MKQEKDPNVEAAISQGKIDLGIVRARLSREIHDEATRWLNDQFPLTQILDERYEWEAHTYYEDKDDQIIRVRFTIFRDDNV